MELAVCREQPASSTPASVRYLGAPDVDEGSVKPRLLKGVASTRGMVRSHHGQRQVPRLHHSGYFVKESSCPDHANHDSFVHVHAVRLGRSADSYNPSCDIQMHDTHIAEQTVQRDVQRDVVPTPPSHLGTPDGRAKAQKVARLSRRSSWSSNNL